MGGGSKTGNAGGRGGGSKTGNAGGRGVKDWKYRWEGVKDWKCRWEGGLNLKKSSAGVIPTDSSHSNV